MTDVALTASPALSTRRVWAQRGVVLAVWLTALIAWRWYQTTNDLTATGAAQRFIDNVEMVWWGIGAYIGVYLVRPVVLFPASVLTVVGGVLFGPIVGVAVVIVAANASAMIAYLIGRSLGRAPGADTNAPANDSTIARWTERLRTNSFEAVLVMRFLFLPYDLVNYAAGALRIKWVPFITATALGSLPGTVSFVLLGASLERVDQGLDGIDPIALVFSVVIFVASLVIARVVRAHQSDTLGTSTGVVPSDHPPQRAAS